MKSSVQKEGESALVAGEYDRAVALLQQAADEDPEDKELQEALGLAKQKAAQMHLSLAEKAEAKNDLRLAVEESEKASLLSDDPLYQARLKKSRDSFDDISEQVSTVIAALSGDTDRSETLQQAEALMVYDLSFPELGPAIESARRRTGEELSAKARRLHEEHKFSSAFSTAKEAVRLSGDKRYEREVKAYKAMALAQRRQSKGDYLTALSEVDRAARALPGDATITTYRQSLVERGSKRLYALAMKASKDGDYLVAIRDLEMLKKVDPKHKRADAELAHARLRFAEVNRLEAQRLEAAEGDKAAGRILMHELLAQRYDQQAEAVDDAVIKARGVLDAEVEMRVFIDLTNASTSAGAEKYLRTHILTALDDPAIKNLSILKREDMLKILHDEEMLKKRAGDAMLAKTPPIRGNDFGIKGVVTQVTVQEVGRDKPSYQSVRYQKGTKVVLTPEAQKRQMELDKAQQDVERAQKALKDAQAIKRKKLATDDPSKSAFENSLVLLDQTYAENDVSDARRSLEAARSRLDIAKRNLVTDEAKVEEPLYIEALYPVYDLSLIGDVKLDFRLIDLMTSEIGREHQVHVTEKISDRYIPGDKIKGIVEDPDALPPVNVLKERLLDRAADESAHRLRIEFAAYTRQYLLRARRMHKEGHDTKAVEQYVRFLASSIAQDDSDIVEAKAFLNTYYGVKVAP